MEDIFNKVRSLAGGGMIFGTDRTRRMLNALGSPDERLKIIHISGTNGKGSLAEYITQILVAAGKKVGTYTSPQVLDYFERFKIDGKDITPQTLAPYFKKVLAVSRGATSFEAETAAALCAFAGEGCEYAVVECGLGGLNDATNAINSKLLAVISSIGLEHTAVLGDTVLKICRHKAGIIKSCPAVVNPLQPPEALEYFKGLGAIFADKPQVTSCGINGQTFIYKGQEYTTRMAGFAQPYNAATAIEAATILKIDQNSIRSGIFNAQLAGRMQIISSRGNTYLVDGCHNPPAFEPLKEFLKSGGVSGATLVFGSLSDKDVSANLSGLEGCFGQVFSVTPQSPRAMDGERQLKILRKYFADARPASLKTALESASGFVVVCGTFTIIKEALDWIEKKS